MDPITGSALIGAAGAGLSFLGGNAANRAARQEAERNRKFQERMRNTAWQAAVADMKAAGLNPAVAYSRGPAASPGGSMASQSDAVTPAVHSAVAAARARSELKLVQEQTRRAVAEADVAEDQRFWSKSRREYYDRFSGTDMAVGGRSLGMMKADRLDALLGSEHGRALAAAAREQGLAAVAGLSGDMAGQFSKFMPAAGRIVDVSAQGMGQLAGVVEVLERAARMRDDAVQAYLGIPKRAALSILSKLKRYKR